MKPLIQFHFYKSRSKDYPEIIRRCKSFEDFVQGKTGSDKNQLSISTVNEVLNNRPGFMYIATSLPKIKGSSAIFMGENVIPFTNELFYKIQDSLYYCYQNGYNETSFQSAHCESDWGCKLLTDTTRFHTDNIWAMARHWYRYGRFEESVWKVDKTAIAHALLTEAKNKRLAVCPMFNLAQVKEYVETLPDEILIDERWTVLTRTELTRDGFKEIPFGIVPADIREHDEPLGPIDWGAKSEEEINEFLDKWLKLRDL
ncbi:MAG TPA: hypothetical protein VKY45_06585 [Marinilabiliaceae bacterium]|nr:hypothetical protein [Marinilabiliaceae bacterium]